MSTTIGQTEKILAGGAWIESNSSEYFHAANPSTLEKLPEAYPLSNWDDCELTLNAAVEAAEELKRVPRESIAKFLRTFADLLDQNAERLATYANLETALPVRPRLAAVEIPRTSSQLRQAAEACVNGSWALPTIDTKANIRSCYEALGPVVVFGPNNFPFAFNGSSGGDFAAAIAAGNPVIAKANTSHPGTTKLIAELAHEAVTHAGLPSATVQLIYRLSHADGEKLVSDRRIGAIGYTGSRSAGLKLKQAADLAGKPIYLELSSVNPVVILPAVMRKRALELAEEFVGSVLMGTGQFCTNPGLILAINNSDTNRFVSNVVERFTGTAPGTLLSAAVQKSLKAAIKTLQGAGATLLCGGEELADRCSITNSLLTVSGSRFLEDPEVFQTEAFGNASLVVLCESTSEMTAIAGALEGNLTGCIYSDKEGEDDADYDAVAPTLTGRVGRVLNDKMPTGVAVSPAMNHGGPFPATGHPGFTAVGIPASLLRFAKLTCYDAVRNHRLPALLQDKNPTGKTFRLIDLEWSTRDIGA